MTTDEYINCLRQFFLRVKEMRDAQKTYFQKRTGDALKNAKDAEREVDSLLRVLEGIVGDQQTMF